MPPIELQYSEKIVRKAVIEFYKRTVGITLPIMFGLMLISFVYLLNTGNVSWVTGVVGSTLAFAIVMMTALYVTHYRITMQKFRAMKDPVAFLELRDDSLKIKADSGSSEIPSKSITEVWAYDDFWLVFLSRAQFFTISTAELSSNTRMTISSRFSEWGVKSS